MLQGYGTGNHVYFMEHIYIKYAIYCRFVIAGLQLEQFFHTLSDKMIVTHTRFYACCKPPSENLSL